MKTPIYDFVRRYAESGAARFHMPGHKGAGKLGCERYDITEIRGADVLDAADGIIAESERHASELFGTAHSFYSTEGSTLAIKTMLALALLGNGGASRTVIAARNVHKAFINAAALLDLDVEFIEGESEHICESLFDAEDVRRALAGAAELPFAVYVTSPDYLGNISDIAGIARVCEEFGVPLLVDNAHGAYLAFLEESRHPIALGASMCADSAHKTLPTLTGGAYLHVSKKCAGYADGAREALSLFASTSPSYLTLCSLDLTNAYIADGYRERLCRLCGRLDAMRKALTQRGMTLCGDEPLKLTLDCNAFGYGGTEVADMLRGKGIECELADGRYVVLMISTGNTDAQLDALLDALCAIEVREPITPPQSFKSRAERVLSVREAMLSPSVRVSVRDSVGRICASPSVSCPPAVPIVVSGERIDEDAVRLFELYGVESVSVVK